MNLHHQLYLAMVWDRVDIAEEKILVHGKNFFIHLGYSSNDIVLIQLLPFCRGNTSAWQGYSGKKLECSE